MSDFGEKAYNLAAKYAKLVSPESEAAMIKFIKESYPDKDFSNITSFPQMTFLNGYYYAKFLERTSKKDSLLEHHLEFPFIEMVREKEYDPKTRTFTKKIDRLIKEGTTDPTLVCFFAGMKTYAKVKRRESAAAN